MKTENIGSKSGEMKARWLVAITSNVIAIACLALAVDQGSDPLELSAKRFVVRDVNGRPVVLSGCPTGRRAARRRFGFGSSTREGRRSGSASARRTFS